MARVVDIDDPNAGREPQWETREITMPRGTTRHEAKSMLTEAAEYGHWELARTRIYTDGRRWVLLRRRLRKIPPQPMFTVR